MKRKPLRIDGVPWRVWVRYAVEAVLVGGAIGMIVMLGSR